MRAALRGRVMSRRDAGRDLRAVKELFAAAVELPPERRRQLLDDSCGDDEELKAEVEALLRADSSAGRFLSQPAAAVDKAQDLEDGVADPLPRVVNQFKLVRRLGEGGFGAVYQAEQEHPVHRVVAMKIIKLGMDTRQVVARFEAERQALAMMDHPNIARVLDAGATEAGRPYFVMELVDGIPITDYCRVNDLTIPERLELFIPVCLAVAHAHHKGVIHRDIKPSNILVSTIDGRPVPKVIDFGVAKATNLTLADATVSTGLRQLIGTLEYMSPEQADLGNPGVDTRTDIYSLGVLLYELLTGVPPFEGRTLRSKGYSEAQRILREDDPPKPSSRLIAAPADAPGLAAKTRTDRKRLSSLLRRDLDWIVMRCLEKDRERRYATAAALADDLRHYLNSEPVWAGPATATYRLGKLARKYRAAIAAATAIAAALIAAVIGTSAGLVHARAALHRAEAAENIATNQRNAAREAQHQAEQNAQRATQEAGRANAVSDYLSGVFALARPESGAGGEDANVTEVLGRAAMEIDSILRDRPEEQLVARTMLGQACERVYLYDQAADQFRRAYDLSVSLPGGAQSARSLSLGGQLATAMYLDGRGAEALPLAQSTFLDARRQLGDRDPVTWEATHACALCCGQAGDTERAFTLLKDLVATVRVCDAGRTPNRLGRYLCNLAVCLRDHGKYEAATAALSEALTLMPRDAGASVGPATQSTTVPDVETTATGEPNVLVSGWVARQIVESGSFIEAMPAIEQKLAQAMKEYPRGTPTLAYRLADVAMLKVRGRDQAGAGDLFSRAISMSCSLLGRVGEADQDRWRKWTLCCNPRLTAAWRSPALQRQVWCALDDLLRDYPPARLAPEEVPVDRLRFKLLEWTGVAAGSSSSLVAEGNLERLESLPDPHPGLYLLGLEVPRLGEPPLRRAQSLLLVPWALEFHAICRFDGIRTSNRRTDRELAGAIFPDAYERRTLLGLGLSDGMELATESPRRLQWFTTTAMALADLPAGRYRFSLSSDDGARLEVDGHVVVDRFEPHPSTTTDGLIDLGGGTHQLRIEHYQEVGSYTLWLQVAPMSAEAKAVTALMGGGVPELDGRINRTVQLIAEFPHDPAFPVERAHTLARAGRFREAAIDYAGVLRADPSDPVTWHVYAAILAYLNRGGEYETACRGIFERFSNSDDAVVRLRALQACCMAPQRAVRAEQIGELLDRTGSQPVPPDFQVVARLARGMAHYRLGKFDKCVEDLRMGTDPLPADLASSRVTTELFMAMAFERQGRRDQARAMLERAENRMRTEVLAAGVEDLNPGGLEQWLACQTVWREVKALVTPTS